jgi:hypothetical protein
LPAERIGEAIYRALTASRPRGRYAMVPNRLIHGTLPNLLPRRVVESLIAKRLGLTRRW